MQKLLVSVKVEFSHYANEVFTYLHTYEHFPSMFKKHVYIKTFTKYIPIYIRSGSLSFTIIVMLTNFVQRTITQIICFICEEKKNVQAYDFKNTVLKWFHQIFFFQLTNKTSVKGTWTMIIVSAFYSIVSWSTFWQLWNTIKSNERTLKKWWANNKLITTSSIRKSSHIFLLFRCLHILLYYEHMYTTNKEEKYEIFLTQK